MSLFIHLSKIIPHSSIGIIIQPTFMTPGGYCLFLLYSMGQ